MIFLDWNWIVNERTVSSVFLEFLRETNWNVERERERNWEIKIDLVEGEANYRAGNYCSRSNHSFDPISRVGGTPVRRVHLTRIIGSPARMCSRYSSKRPTGHRGKGTKGGIETVRATRRKYVWTWKNFSPPGELIMELHACRKLSLAIN